MVVFDMAGTTIADQNEVANCFYEAAMTSGLNASKERLLSMMGWSKITVFQTLWSEQLGADHPDIEEKIADSFQTFRNILEAYYDNHPVRPTAGAEELFQFLKARGIVVALTTGFYRKVANQLLGKLGWDKGLDERYIGNDSSIIDISITSEEVEKGRPAPFMIQKAMQVFGIDDPKEVVKIGDTPSDLEAAAAAGCFAFALTDGSHRRDILEKFPHHGLFPSMASFKAYIEKQIL